MAVKQVNKDKRTKDGRSWYFYTPVKDQLTGKSKKYNSKLYATKNEALKAEREFKLSVEKKQINITDMTFKDLYESFYDYKQDKVKSTTLRTYRQRVVYLQVLDKVKIRDFNVKHYQEWRSTIAKLPLEVKTKNGFHKFFKEILNYGTKWYDFNFTSIYNKMEKFENPNALPKEMKFYTYEEFIKFISVEDDLKFKTMFEVLYYCGLRRGELRGLTWDNFDIERKEISIVKNVVNEDGDCGYWKLTTPKTRTSTRTIPIPDCLYNELKLYKEKCKKQQYGWTEKFFIFGDNNPIHPDAMRRRKKRNAELAEIKEIRLHDFRHSCASLLINNGANIMIVAKYLGHAKIDETLNTYAHMFKSSMNEVVNMLNQLN